MGDISYIAESAIYGEVFKKTSSKAKNGHQEIRVGHCTIRFILHGSVCMYTCVCTYLCGSGGRVSYSMALSTFLRLNKNCPHMVTNYIEHALQ